MSLQGNTFNYGVLQKAKAGGCGFFDLILVCRWRTVV